MKKIFFFLSLLLFSLVGYSQTWNEFFRQKRTQIRYLVQQIAALQVYIELGKKGYGIYKDGLTLIGDIKDGEFNLHKNYFASLDAVNPHIMNMREVQEMLNWREQIFILAERVRKKDLGADHASIIRLFEGLVQRSKNDIRQLELLLSDNAYQLTDAERLSQIKRLHGHKKMLHAFALLTFQDAAGLSGQKRAAEKDGRIINSFHGLN